ncbi:MAG: cobalamin-dependent protein [Polyangiaceae bacterium]|nr:cobalamin-dependent protein [Polyangiaceae bacterium]
MMRGEEVILVRPPGERRRAHSTAQPHQYSSGAPTVDFGYECYESLGLGYVAAYLRRHGVSVSIFDGTIDPVRCEEMVDVIVEKNPLLVGFSILWDGYDDVRKMCSQVRARGFRGHLTVGQHFATFNADRVLNDTPEMDSVVRFEGEHTALEMVERLRAGLDLQGVLGVAFRNGAGGVIETPPRPLVADLDALPFPARDVLSRNRDQINWVTMSGSRGCPWRCKFCTITNFYKTPPGKIFRHRSPRSIVDEMEQIIELYGKNRFSFTDDQFLGAGSSGRAFALGVADEILRRGLKVAIYLATRADSVDETVFARLRDAGVVDVFLGIESAFQPTLDYFRKDITVDQNRRAIGILKSLGIGLHLGFIMFHERSSLDEVRANIDFLREVELMSWEGPGMFFGDMSIFSGTDFMRETRNKALSPEQAYKAPWDIQDPLTRRYRSWMRTILAPLATPFQTFSRHRARGSVPAGVLQICEEKMRSTSLGIASEMLDRVKLNSQSESHVDEARKTMEDEATRLQCALEIAEMLSDQSRAEPARAGLFL